jgi:phytoene dehydrogenase-like protein
MGELKKLFPKVKGNIDFYFRDIQHAADYTSYFLLRFILPPILHTVSERFFASGKKFSSLSVEEYIDSLSNDKYLKTALSGQLQNFASCREGTGFIFHAMNMMGSLNGSFAPKGGPEQLYRILKENYTSHGGVIFESSTVDEVKISGKKIKELSILKFGGGITRVNCKKIFWGMGMENFPELIREDKTRNYYFSLSPKKEFVPYPLLFEITLNNEIKKSKNKGEIFRLFPSKSADADEIPQACNLYPLYSDDPLISVPQKYIAVLFVNGDNPGEFLQNSENIFDLKEYLIEMINLYLKEFAGCITSVEFIKSGALTNKFFINPYGTVMPSTNKVKRQLHKNPYGLKNLFVTGADMFIPGVTASFMSGITTIGVAFGAFRFFRFFRFLKNQANKKIKIKIKPLKVKQS